MWPRSRSHPSPKARPSPTQTPLILPQPRALPLPLHRSPKLRRLQHPRFRVAASPRHKKPRCPHPNRNPLVAEKQRVPPSREKPARPRLLPPARHAVPRPPRRPHRCSARRAQPARAPDPHGPGNHKQSTRVHVAPRHRKPRALDLDASAHHRPNQRTPARAGTRAPGESPQTMTPLQGSRTRHSMAQPRVQHGQGPGSECSQDTCPRQPLVPT